MVAEAEKSWLRNQHRTKRVLDAREGSMEPEARTGGRSHDDVVVVVAAVASAVVVAAAAFAVAVPPAFVEILMDLWEY